MDVRIGVTYSPKEIVLELTDDTDREALRQQVEEALQGPVSVLWLTDRRGRYVGVPTDRVAYVDIGTRSDRAVGFGAG